MGIEGYVGTPIFNKKGEGIGVIVSLFKDAIEDHHFVTSIVITSYSIHYTKLYE